MADTIFYYQDGTTSTSSDAILTIFSRNILKTLVSVKIGDAVTTIGDNCFESGFNCNLSEIIIPDNVLLIKSFAFAFDITLKKVIIGKGISNIEGYAFFNCNVLTKIYFSGNCPNFETDSLVNNNPNLKLYRKKNFVTGWPNSVQGVPVVLWSDNVIKSGGTGKLTTKKRN